MRSRPKRHCQAMVMSGGDGPRRIAARPDAGSLGIELQSLPKPVDPTACASAPQISPRLLWFCQITHPGDFVADAAAEQHRPCTPALHPENIFDPALRSLEKFDPGTKSAQPSALPEEL